MKHLQAGLLLGVVSLVVLLVIALAWGIANWLVGPILATGMVIVVAGITVAGIIIDWKTERR